TGTRTRPSTTRSRPPAAPPPRRTRTRCARPSSRRSAASTRSREPNASTASRSAARRTKSSISRRENHHPVGSVSFPRCLGTHVGDDPGGDAVEEPLRRLTHRPLSRLGPDDDLDRLAGAKELLDRGDPPLERPLVDDRIEGDFLHPLDIARFHVGYFASHAFRACFCEACFSCFAARFSLSDRPGFLDWPDGVDFVAMNAEYGRLRCGRDHQPHRAWL